MEAAEIKTRISIEQVLGHYGSAPTETGTFRCPVSGNHANRDSHPSGKVFNSRAYCHSQQCFTERGADIFAVVELMEQIPNFTEQKTFIATTFGLTNGTPPTDTPAIKRSSTNTQPKIIAEYDYTNFKGELVFQVVRYEPKTFRQRRPDGNGGWHWNLKGTPLVLYRLFEAVAASHVIICEGEKDVESLFALGLPDGSSATTSPMGGGKWKEQYSNFLAQKTIIIIPDQDKVGIGHGEKVAQALLGIAKEIRWLTLPGEHKDPTDWIQAGGTAEELQALISAAKPWVPGQHIDTQALSTKSSSTLTPKKSQATILVDLVEGLQCTLFYDDAREAYASVPKGNHQECWPVYSVGFKEWLSMKYREGHNSSPGNRAISDALVNIAGLAKFGDGNKEEPVFTRVGGNNLEVFIDLGDDVWSMVHIKPEGWKVIPHGSVRFRRSTGMKALPAPVSGGDIKALLSAFVNLSTDDDWSLLIGYLVAAIRPVGSHLILEINGEQGSGKTTFTDVLKAIIDPNKASKRTQPKEERDLMIGATNNWMLAFDNLSGLQPWQSDALCRLSTGGAIVSRTLYTDKDEAMLEARRPTIVNGIGSVSNRPDLLDRSITLYLAQISEQDRKPEAEFWEDFHRVSGQIFGALCDAVASALKHRPTTHLPTIERMADAVLWVTAAEPGLGWDHGTFQAAYRENRQALNETALEGSLIYEPLCTFLNQIGTQWEGTGSELLEALALIAPEKITKQKMWPTNARALRIALQRIVPNLRAIGITVVFLETKIKNRRLIQIGLDGVATSRTPVDKPEASPTSPEPQEGMFPEEERVNPWN